MYHFNSDYCEGAHPRVLKKLVETNLEQTPGYGEDAYCKKAAGLIRAKCGREDIDIHFFTGGTQTNLTVISACLRPHQAVVTAESGHINTHESGAIEATGHKVLALPSIDGKLTAQMVRDVYAAHYEDETREHIVQPKLVYISNPTETGTIYTKAELTALSRACRENGLLLYMDGARLGYALCAEGNDLDLPEITDLCDVFYIGGTKVGALFGEALVIVSDSLKPDFRYIIKQKGGLFAKGRLLGLQFIALFEDGLYCEIACRANKLAAVIRDACLIKGCGFLTESVTNQQFPILPDSLLQSLKADFACSYWKRIDPRHSAVRFVTSWATPPEAVGKLAEAILKG